MRFKRHASAAFLLLGYRPSGITESFPYKRQQAPWPLATLVELCFRIGSQVLKD